ncbi:MAG: hypothetical protein ACLVB1_07545 [Blautia obeum]
MGYDGLYSDDVSRILSRLEENQDVWAYAHTYRNRDILILGRRIYEQYSQSRVIGYTLISMMKKFFQTVLEPVGLADSSNIMYLNMDGTILSSWDRNINSGQKTEKKLLKNIQARLPTEPIPSASTKMAKNSWSLIFSTKSSTSFLCTPCLIIISIPKFIPCFAES